MRRSYAVWRAFWSDRRAAVAAVFLLVPTIVIFMLAQRQVIETMAHSGIKD